MEWQLLIDWVHTHFELLVVGLLLAIWWEK